MTTRPKWLTAAWLVLLLPGILQFILLCIAMFSRLGYGYDLEWMEGGVLAHAQRIADGDGIYVDPSVDFIPFLYTPLYPGLLAMFSELFGISYAAGRTISILSTLAMCALVVLIIRHERGRRDLSLASWSGAACAIGFIAATYPWVEGWYDLVRADSLFMLMVVGGLFGLRIWSREPGQQGLAKTACAATVLGLSFFAKQTGVLFVATGGFMLLVLNWRRVPAYVAITGTIGLGGTWLLNRVTSGWFWVYIYETHQHHDFNMDRFYKSFHYILWHFPAMTIVIALGLFATLLTLIGKRSVSAPGRGLLMWTPVFAFSVLVGAIGWGTQFAHFNAYIPAMVFGALCAGLSIAALITAVAPWLASAEGRHAIVAPLVGALAAAALGISLLFVWWKPTILIPTKADTKAGNQLIRTIRSVEGDVLIPYHPWYAKLAGKPLKVHLMGLRDMTTGKVWPIRGLREALQSQSFGAVIMDNRPLGRELSLMKSTYRMDDHLQGASPHVYTGAGAVWNRDVHTLIPRSIWVPNRPLDIPVGARALWDFEAGSWQGWRVSGKAWGARPVRKALPKQGPVRRYGGRYYVSSYHGGDSSVGTLESPAFTIEGSTISFRLSGGKSENLRAELHIDGKAVKSATGENSERMQEIRWNITAHAGKTARILLVDEEKGSWGHLNADEFWLWE